MASWCSMEKDTERNNMTKELKTITEEEFDKLPKLEQRVLIAQDVLAQLAAKKFKPKRGEYFNFGITPSKFKKLFPDASKSAETRVFHNWEFRNSCPTANMNSKFFASISAQKLIQDIDSCHVCAKGAVVCSFLNKFNKKSVRDISASDQRVVRIFGRALWSEMEAQFEGNSGYRVDSFYDKLDYNLKPRSIKSIMEEIVRNGGYLLVKDQSGKKVRVG